MSDRRRPMLVLDGTSLLTALPEIETGLHLHGPAVQWTVAAMGGPAVLRPPPVATFLEMRHPNRRW